MKIYAFSGLGADYRVFQNLTLDCELIPVDWIAPEHKESIGNYASRISQVIDTTPPFGILGVSFGGLIATEVSKKLNPELTILISSAETKYELRSVYRLIGKTGLIGLIPSKLFDPPRKIAHWIFGAQDTQLLNQILDDTDLIFAKWAVQTLTSWNNTEKLKNRLIKIGGTHDKLIPTPKDTSIQLIENGKHFMIVDRAKEISAKINNYLSAGYK